MLKGVIQVTLKQFLLKDDNYYKNYTNIKKIICKDGFTAYITKNYWELQHRYFLSSQLFETYTLSTEQDDPLITRYNTKTWEVYPSGIHYDMVPFNTINELIKKHGGLIDK